MPNERYSLSKEPTDHPAPAADMSKPPSDAELEEFVEKAKASPETIDWNTVTKAQRDAIVRSYGIEPIDWEGMSDEELQAAREKDMIEFVSRTPTYDVNMWLQSQFLTGSPEDRSRELRHEMLQSGYIDDFGNAVLAFQLLEGQNKARIEAEKKRPFKVGKDKGFNTYSSRNRPSLNELALTQPSVHRRLDALMTEAYNALQNDDVATIKEKVNEFYLLDHETRKRRDELTKKVDFEWPRAHLKRTGVSPKFFKKGALLIGDPKQWQENDERWLNVFVDLVKESALPTYTQQVGKADPELYSQSNSDKVASIDALVTQINAAAKQDDLETIKTNLVQLFALRDQPLES